MIETEKTSLFDGQGTEAERRAALHAAQEFLEPQSRQLAQQALKGEPTLFEAAESALLAEARERAYDSGRLVPFHRRDDTGRKVTQYEGDPAAWMAPFMLPSAVARIDTNVGTHEETVRLKEGQRIVISQG